MAFAMLQDGSHAQSIQVVFPLALLESQPALRHLSAGCALRLLGHWVSSQGHEQTHELLVQEVLHLGGVEDPLTYPIQPKPLSVDFLRSVPHLRQRTGTVGAVSRLRHGLMRAVHDYFDQHGFCWVATPILTPTDAEGAGERFRVHASGMDGQLEPFFDVPMFLTVSGQMEAEAQAMGLYVWPYVSSRTLSHVTALG